MRLLVYRPSDLATRWGVSDNTVRAEIERGALSAFRIGKLYRIKASELKRGTGEGENPIPIQAMTWLAPILNDDQPRDALEEATDEPAAEAKA